MYLSLIYVPTVHTCSSENMSQIIPYRDEIHLSFNNRDHALLGDLCRLYFELLNGEVFFFFQLFWSSRTQLG